MNITDAVFLVCGSIVGVFILGMFVSEITRDSKLKRQMRAAGVSEEHIRETLRIVDLGRSRARKTPECSGLPGLKRLSRHNKAA